MWTTNPYPGLEGKYFSMPPRPVLPKPRQDPHPPLWMACTQPASFDLAADWGDRRDETKAIEMGDVAALWYGAQTAKLFAPWLGKDVDGYSYYTNLVRDPAYRKELSVPPAERLRDQYSLVGTPEKVARSVQSYIDVGADMIVCRVQAGRIPRAKILNGLGLFGEKVMPRCR